MKNSLTRVQQQRGAALFVALIILLVVSLIGISAMKSSAFHERMAFNSQAEELTFQAAETGINGVISHALSNLSWLTHIKDNHGASRLNNCITSAGIDVADAACTDADTLDARGKLMSDAETKYDGRKPLIGTDPDAQANYQFSTIGKGGFIAATALPFSSENYQEWRKIGPANGHFTVDGDMLSDMQ